MTVTTIRKHCSKMHKRSCQNVYFLQVTVNIVCMCVSLTMWMTCCSVALPAYTQGLSSTSLNQYAAPLHTTVPMLWIRRRANTSSLSLWYSINIIRNQRLWTESQKHTRPRGHTDGHASLSLARTLTSEHVIRHGGFCEREPKYVNTHKHTVSLTLGS